MNHLLLVESTLVYRKYTITENGNDLESVNVSVTP